MHALMVASALWLASPSEQSILADLERLDQSLSQTEASLRANESTRTQLQEELAGLQSSLAHAKLRQHAALTQYRKRVRALARLPDGARWALLGGSASLADYLDTTRLLRWVAQHDRKLHAHLQQENERLNVLTVRLRQRREALDNVIADTRARRDSLAGDRRARAELLRGVQQERSRAEALARERRTAQEKLRTMVSRLETPAGPPPPRRSPVVLPRLSPGRDGARLDVSRLRGRFAQNRGRLPWPAAGPLRVAFGDRVELAFGTVTSHNGWDIGAAAGARVQAVASGQIVYAGWLRGYGQMVIVDHGDGFHSVAAHLANIDVQVGDAVAPGQTLGTVGDTGSLRGTVLYFEIRYKGVPVDPRVWLRQ